MPNISVDRQDFDCIIDALKMQLTKSQFKRAEQLVQRLTTPHAPKGANWAPIRSAWPSGFSKSQPKPNSFFHKPRDPKVAKAKQPPTADEILAGL